MADFNNEFTADQERTMREAGWQRTSQGMNAVARSIGRPFNTVLSAQQGADMRDAMDVSDAVPRRQDD